MNAQTDEFGDSDSSYTPSRRIFRDLTGNTAMPEYEWLRKETGIVHYLPYKSNAPTTAELVGRAGVLHTFLKGSYSFVTVIRDRESDDLGSIYSALPASESSTLPIEKSWEELDWSSCLAGFADEDVEDGMTATLGERISILIRFRGSKAIEELKVLISSNSISPSLASHTLRWLGRIKEAASFDLRLALLCENLRSKSPVVRDGASLGLAALGSPKAIPDLQNAIKHEKLPGLRADMERVLRELQF